MTLFSVLSADTRKERWTNRLLELLTYVTIKMASQNMCIERLTQYTISPWPKKLRNAIIAQAKQQDGPTDRLTDKVRQTEEWMDKWTDRPY